MFYTEHPCVFFTGTLKVLDNPKFIPIDPLQVFFDHRKSNQTGNILDPLSKITKRRTSVHTVFVGIDITLKLAGIRH